jgi:hypothetical protein
MADALDLHQTAVPGDRFGTQDDECPCDICHASSPNRSGPRVLTGLDPIPGESLIGLVARTSGANWLPRLRPILAATTSYWHVHYNLAARDDVDFAKLAFVCRLPPQAVEERRYRPDEIMAEMPGVGFHGATIPVYDLELRACRVTPSWLRAGYHSALGHHALATHCPQSGELLIDSCPRCGTGLNWTRSAFDTCHRCDLDISRHQGETVPQRLAEATRPMVDVVHPDPARHVPAAQALPPLLRDLDRGLVFEIGWRMGCVLTGNGLYDRDTAKRLSVPTRLEILGAGAKAIAAWPGSLTDALQGLAPGSNGPALEIASAARRLPTFKNAWPDLKAAFHTAAPGLKGGPLRAVKASLTNGVNSGELERTLGVSQKVVARLRGTELTAAIAVGDVNSHQIFEGAGLERLRWLLGDRIAVGTIAERMAISRHGLEQLACLGEIEVFDRGAVNVAYAQRQARRSDFDRLLARLAEASIAIDKADGMPIHRSMRAIGGREKPWGPVIVAMLRGDIAFSLDEGDGKFLERVRILSGHLHKVVALQFDTTDHPDFAFDATINGRDTEELLNIFPKSTRVARDEGALPAPVDGAHIRAVILNLASKNISESEVLARWNGANRRLPAPLQGRRRLLRISKLGWDRTAVEMAMVITGLPDRGNPACAGQL